MIQQNKFFFPWEIYKCNFGAEPQKEPRKSVCPTLLVFSRLRCWDNTISISHIALRENAIYIRLNHLEPFLKPQPYVLGITINILHNLDVFISYQSIQFLK